MKAQHPNITVLPEISLTTYTPTLLGGLSNSNANVDYAL
jgi:hypothetical protein